MTEYISTADALFFHQLLIERYGGTSGLRDAGALESALHRPQTGYYDTLIHEAAALLGSLIQNTLSWTANAWRLPSSMSSCVLTVSRLLRTHGRSSQPC
jgi:prophage maintenance system killer protein